MADPGLRPQEKRLSINPVLMLSHSERCDLYDFMCLPSKKVSLRVSVWLMRTSQTMKNLGCLAFSGGNSVHGIAVDVFMFMKGFQVEDDLFCICTVVRTKKY